MRKTLNIVTSQEDHRSRNLTAVLKRIKNKNFSLVSYKHGVNFGDRIIALAKKQIYAEKYLISLAQNKSVYATVFDNAKLKDYDQSTLMINFLGKELNQVNDIKKACDLAVKNNCAISIGGAGHLVCKDNKNNKSFALLNGLIMAAKHVQKSKETEKVLIVDLDADMGYGTTSFISNDQSVKIFDMYDDFMNSSSFSNDNAQVYKFPMNAITSDNKYLTTLEDNLTHVVGEFRPGFVIYYNGSSILKTGDFESFSLSEKSAIKKDELVSNICVSKDIPLVMITDDLRKESSLQYYKKSIKNLSEKLFSNN